MKSLTSKKPIAFYLSFLISLFLLASCSNDDDALTEPQTTENPAGENETEEEEEEEEVISETSTELKITDFGFSSFLNPNVPINSKFEVVIDNESKEIEVITSLGFYTNYLTNFTPQIDVPENITISPEGAQNFSDTVVYTISDSNGNSINYNVNIILSETDVLASVLLSNGGAYPQDWVLKYARSISISEWEGVILNDSGSVTELNLKNKNLSVIPDRIKMLPNLQRLNLSENNNLSSIPQVICDMETNGLELIKNDNLSCN